MNTQLMDVPLDLAFNQGRTYVQGVTLLEEAARLFSLVTGLSADNAPDWTLAGQFKRELRLNARMLHFTSMEDASLLVAHGGTTFFTFKSPQAQHVFVAVEDKNRPVTRQTESDIFGASTLDPVEGDEGWELDITFGSWLPLAYLIDRAHIKVIQKQNKEADLVRWAFFDSLSLVSCANTTQTRVVFGAPRILPTRAGYFDYRRVRVEQDGKVRHMNNAIMVYKKV